VITGDDLTAMVAYWLATPQNSRLGTGFGNNAADLLGEPNSEGIANDFIKKMLNDLPILQVLPSGSVNVYAVPRGGDGLDLYVDVNGSLFPITSG
jgi:hypothetical protein